MNEATEWFAMYMKTEGVCVYRVKRIRKKIRKRVVGDGSLDEQGRRAFYMFQE